MRALYLVIWTGNRPRPSAFSFPIFKGKSILEERLNWDNDRNRKLGNRLLLKIMIEIKNIIQGYN